MGIVVIPAYGSQRQEDCYKFLASQGYTIGSEEKPIIIIKRKI